MSERIKSERFNSERFKKFLPYILAIVGFILAGYAYAPYTLSGKVVNQSDISSWQGMSHEIVDWNENHPDDPTYWTNSMFGGMPANTISIKYKGDLTQYIYDILFIGQRPASYLIISMIGAFLLFLSLGVNIWLSILGAIAISFCSYNMQIIQVGHNTKMIAIAFMPWVLASLVYAYKRRWLLGALLFGVTLSFQIKANHPQITYYLAIIVLGFALWQLFSSIKRKTFGNFIKTSVALLVAGLLGIGSNINHLWPTYEYGKQSMRGGSELANTKANEKGANGLDLEYATQWSYGIEETPNLLIPNFNGGSSAGELSKSSETYRTLSQRYSGADEIIKQLPLYWGPQPFTAGPMYLGAITIFLFIFGLFVIKSGVKWWLKAVSVIAILLSWGYHFMAPTEFFFNNVPMYNKFRTVSMILVILQLTVPILAILALSISLEGENKILNIPATESKKNRRGLFWTVGIVGGFCLLFGLFPSIAGSFTSSTDSSLPKDIANSLALDRASLLKKDAFRSLWLVLVAAAILLCGINGKLKKKYVYIALIFFTLIDLWGVDKRYLNASHFVTEREFSAPLAKRGVDDFILDSDKDLSYRVLDLSIDPFNNAYPSYYHKTIGGYSPAKIQRYQDLIERNISVETNALITDLNSSGASTIEEANNALGYYKILSMLNTRYIILGAEQPPLVNSRALGNCWFVDSIINVKGANEEIEKLAEIDPATTAVVSLENEAAIIKDFSLNNNSLNNIELNNIELISYAPNRLKYRYSSNKPQVALFSEVYFAPGWSAKFTGTLYDEEISGKNSERVENKDIEIFRANYILRGIYLPKGEGEIEFYYLPESIVKGAKYSLICSSILLLLLIGALIKYFRSICC